MRERRRGGGREREKGGRKERQRREEGGREGRKREEERRKVGGEWGTDGVQGGKWNVSDPKHKSAPSPARHIVKRTFHG